MNVGEKIRYLRIKNDMSVDDLAKAIGKNRATIYRYENGDIDNMPYKVIEPIAKALNVLPSYFFDTKDDIDIETVINQESFQQCLKIWITDVDCVEFNPDELNELMDYAKYLISKRK